jgi:putative ABC transport system permease protein
LRETLVEAQRGPLALVLTAVLAFLLLACANLAALLGTRASVRQREYAVRLALGASRWALSRQSPFEAGLLVLVGGGLGLALAVPCMDLGTGEYYRDLLGNTPPRLDWRVLLAFLGLLSISAAAGTLGPALQNRRLQPMDALRGEGRSSQSRRARRSRELLVAVQVAASLTPDAGLLARSIRALLAIDPGFRSDGVVTAKVLAPTLRRGPGVEGWVSQREDAARRMRSTFERLKQLPELRSVCLATDLPVDYITDGGPVEGEAATGAVYVHWVSPDCFAALGIRLLSGRDFTTQDGLTPLRAIVNRSFARRLLGVEDAVGHHLRGAVPPGSNRRRGSRPECRSTAGHQGPRCAEQ